MTTVVTQSVPAQPLEIPPLRHGERLSRDEFERRYHAMPRDVKAELLEGVVYMASPVNEVYHSNPDFNLITWLGFYQFGTPGVIGGANGTLRLDMDNEPQPDAYLRILPAFGGQSRTSEDGYVIGAPEWVGEVSASSLDYDLGLKLNIYRRNGVKEYVVWRTYAQAIDWFVLRESQFEKMTVDADGIYRSQIFPGLWLDPQALVQADLPRVRNVLEEGIASAEHAEFVRKLQLTSSPPAKNR